jgi:type IV pilus assembly protein PilA
MKTAGRLEKGFTLVGLLVGVALLGVIAAIVIPNITRFMSQEEAEAAKTELRIIQSSVTVMMQKNQLSTLPRPVSRATNDMSAFPDTSFCVLEKKIDPNGNPYIIKGDKNGYILFQHDIIGDGTQVRLVNYIATQFTKGTYYADSSGKVYQQTTGYE